MADETDGLVSAGGWCAPSETIYDMRSRERQLWLGLAEPTEEEIAEATRALYEDYAEDREAWERTQAFLDVCRAARPEGLASEMLVLHARTEYGDCRHCNGWEGSNVEWPCATARIALRSIGIEIPEVVLSVEPPEPHHDLDNPRWPFPAEPVEEFTLPEIAVPRGGIRYERLHPVKEEAT